jgi:hypothetical protein
MAQSADYVDLRKHYERAADSPVATGDHVYGKQVIGFCHSHEGDHILVEGEENLSECPDRPLPCREDPPELERTGPSPVADLPADYLQPAPADLRAAVENAFGSREDGQFVRRLLGDITTRKHHAWLVGGAVRDPLSGRPDVVVKDFDLTGTIGPSCLGGTADLRRISGVGDYIPWISPQNVWSVTPSRQGMQRLVEYKPLARPGFRFPVWGGTLAEDAATRDLTFNALYYDWHSGVLADPCGEGLAHLKARVMATPSRSTELVEQACIILRALKFRLRHPELDITRMRAWIRDELPGDIVASITRPADWRRLVMVRRWSVLPELNGRDEDIEVGAFGKNVADLVREIRARA